MVGKVRNAVGGPVLGALHGKRAGVGGVES
jgi:hypothetical protein